MKKYTPYIILSLVIIFLIINGEIIRGKLNNKTDRLTSEIERYADLKKVSDGVYSDYVITEAKRRELVDSMRKGNNELRLLYKRLRKDNEKINELQSLVLRLSTHIDTISLHRDTIYIGVDTMYQKIFNAFYPSPDNWFVKHKGVIRDNNMISSWDFSDLELSLAQTTTSSGLQKVYLVAPPWITAQAINVLSTSTPDKQKLFSLWIGGGWSSAYDKSWMGPNIKGAVSIKSKFMVTGTLGTKYANLSLMYGL